MSDESDGGQESRRFVFDDHRHVSYGPGPEDDYWTLTFTDDEVGRVDLRLDEDAMYELWIEVSDVPWPRDGTEAGDLRREIVHKTRGMDAEMLEVVLDCAEWLRGGTKARDLRRELVAKIQRADDETLEQLLGLFNTRDKLGKIGGDER